MDADRSSRWVGQEAGGAAVSKRLPPPSHSS
jgi:hypothetical protein